MIFRTREGTYARGETEEDVVSDMHSQSRTPAPNDREWMNKCAAMVLMQTGKRISARSAKRFLEDLISAELLFKEECH
jgi:hypothetical protein